MTKKNLDSFQDAELSEDNLQGVSGGGLFDLGALVRMLGGAQMMQPVNGAGAAASAASAGPATMAGAGAAASAASAGRATMAGAQSMGGAAASASGAARQAATPMAPPRAGAATRMG